MLPAINMNRFMWLLCCEISLAFLLCQLTKKFGKHWPMHIVNYPCYGLIMMSSFVTTSNQRVAGIFLVNVLLVMPLLCNLANPNVSRR